MTGFITISAIQAGNKKNNSLHSVTLRSQPTQCLHRP